MRLALDSEAQKASSRLDIRMADRHQHKDWDDYVRGCASGRLCHDWRWAELGRTVLDHEPQYLIATRNDSVEGVLPLTRVRSQVFGDYLVSVPLLNYGGALANSETVASQLLLAAGERALELGCPQQQGIWFGVAESLDDFVSLLK